MNQIHANWIPKFTVLEWRSFGRLIFKFLLESSPCWKFIINYFSCAVLVLTNREGVWTFQPSESSKHAHFPPEKCSSECRHDKLLRTLDTLLSLKNSLLCPPSFVLVCLFVFFLTFYYIFFFNSNFSYNRLCRRLNTKLLCGRRINFFKSSKTWKWRSMICRKSRPQNFVTTG